MPRLLVVPFAALALWIGIAFLVGPPERTSSSTYAPAKAVIPAFIPIDPMRVWGIVFMVGFAALAWGVVAPPAITELTLFVGGGIYMWWATLLLIAMIRDPFASGSAPGIWGFVGLVHYLGTWRMHLERRGCADLLCKRCTYRDY